MTRELLAHVRPSLVPPIVVAGSSCILFGLGNLRWALRWRHRRDEYLRSSAPELRGHNAWRWRTGVVHGLVMGPVYAVLGVWVLVQLV